MEIFCCCCEILGDCDFNGNNSDANCCECFIEAYDSNINNKRRAIRFWDQCLVNAAIVPLLVLCIVLLASSPFDYSAFVDNWNIVPLVSIQIHEECPKQMEILSKITLQGTNMGCICLNDSGRAYYEPCTQEQIDEGCNTYPGYTPKDMFYWSQITQDGNYSTIQICGQRAGLSLYTQLERNIFTREDCVSNKMYVCETSNKNWYYCASDVTQCPITKLTISLTPIDEEGNEIIAFDKYYIYILRKFASTPLINLNITQAANICQNKDELYGDYDVYSLQYIQGSKCEIDNMYIKISETKADNILQSNNLTDYMKQTRPLYDLSIQQNYTLFGLNYYKFNPQCRQQLWMALQDNIQLQNDNYVTLSCYMTFISICFITSWIINCNELFRCMYNDCGLGAFWLFYFGKIVFELPVMVCIFVSYGYTRKLLNNLELFTLSCLDEHLIATQTQLQDVVDQMVSQTTGCFVIIIIIIICEIGFAVWHFYLHYNQYVLSSEVQNHGQATIKNGQHKYIDYNIQMKDYAHSPVGYS